MSSPAALRDLDGGCRCREGVLMVRLRDPGAEIPELVRRLTSLGACITAVESGPAQPGGALSNGPEELPCLESVWF